MKQLSVAILGASDKPERFSYKAFQLLKAHSHRVVLVSPNLQILQGTPVLPRISSIETEIHTLTMYVSERVSTSLINEILKLKPKRVIFNPGSENPNIEDSLTKAGIEVIHGCTLIMLNTNTF